MAYYGIPSAGAALTAASTNDKITIKDLGGTDVSAQSVYGADGNDVISLGALGITSTASATINIPSSTLLVLPVMNCERSSATFHRRWP